MAKANKGITSENWNDYFTPFTSGVTLNVTQNPKYYGKYWGLDTNDWITINYADLRMFDPAAYDVGQKGLPNLHVFFSSSSKITIKGKNLGLFIPAAFGMEVAGVNDQGHGILSVPKARENLAKQRVVIEADNVGMVGWADRDSKYVLSPLNISNSMTHDGR